MLLKFYRQKFFYSLGAPSLGAPFRNPRVVFFNQNPVVAPIQMPAEHVLSVPVVIGNSSIWYIRIYIPGPRAYIRAYSYVLLPYVRTYITPVQVGVNTFVLVFRVLVYSRQTADISKSWLSHVQHDAVEVLLSPSRRSPHPL